LGGGEGLGTKGRNLVAIIMYQAMKRCWESPLKPLHQRRAGATGGFVRKKVFKRDHKWKMWGHKRALGRLGDGKPSRGKKRVARGK